MSKERKIDDKDLAEITGAGGVMDNPIVDVTDSTPVHDSGFGTESEREPVDSGGSGPSGPEPAGGGGSGNQTPGM